MPHTFSINVTTTNGREAAREALLIAIAGRNPDGYKFKLAASRAPESNLSKPHLGTSGTSADRMRHLLQELSELVGDALSRSLGAPPPEWMFGDSVAARNALQNSGKVHPLTCGNTKCRESTNQHPLRAVENGWVCDHCGYTQPKTN